MTMQWVKNTSIDIFQHISSLRVVHPTAMPAKRKWKKWWTTKQKKPPITAVIHCFRVLLDLALCLAPSFALSPNAFWFFYQEPKAETSRVPKGEWSIPAQCGKLLSGPSVAAMEVYHHGYLISQPHLRDQQGQFSALSTLPPFFDVLRPHPLAWVSQSVIAAKREKPWERQKKIKDWTKQMCKTKLLMSRRVCKNVDQGFNESWQSTSRACPQWNDPLTEQKSGDLSVSLLSEAKWSSVGTGFEANVVRVNEAFRVLAWASNQPLSTPQVKSTVLIISVHCWKWYTVQAFSARPQWRAIH